MKKIVLYADWTDIIGHLTSFYAVCENEEGKTAEQIEKEKQAYLEENLKSFFASVKEIRAQGYDVDCHVITGGTREYIMPMFMENKTNAVFTAEPLADILAVSTTAILFMIQFKKTMKEICKENMIT